MKLSVIPLFALLFTLPAAIAQGYNAIIVAPTIDYYDCPHTIPSAACQIGGHYSVNDKIYIQCMTDQGTSRINGDPRWLKLSNFQSRWISLGSIPAGGISAGKINMCVITG